VAELIRNKVEVIVTFDNDATQAAKRATRTIPIVMAVAALAVDTGLVDSYARPGANITGIDWSPVPELFEKRYQFLKAAAPNAKRVVRLFDPTAQQSSQFGEEYLRSVSARLNLSIITVEMSRAEDLPAVLEKISGVRADALQVAGYESIRAKFPDIAAFCTRQKLVSLGPAGYAYAGGLMQHGAHLPTITVRIASYIAQILRGSKPGDLPVEQPTKYELVLNAKTARALGLKLSPAFMLQVDRTIE